MRIKLATVALLFTLLMPAVVLAQPAAMTPDTMAAPAMAAPVMAVAPVMEAAMAAPVTPVMEAAMAAPMAVTPAMEAAMAPVTESAMEAAMVAPMAPPKIIPVAVVNKVMDDEAKLEAAAAAKAADVADAAVTPDPAPAAKPAPVETAKPTLEATPTQAVKAAPIEKKGSWWKVLLSGLTSILLLFLSAIATGLGALLIKWVASKTKLSDAEGLVEAEKLYNAAVEMGVDYAEQQAKKLAGDPDAKGKRIEWAIEKIQATIKDLGLVEKATDWIRTRIEAKLGQQNRSKSSVSPPESPKAAETKK
jgi:hypothetical protein